MKVIDRAEAASTIAVKTSFKLRFAADFARRPAQNYQGKLLTLKPSVIQGR
jgi:hypothetical protein